MPNLLSSAMLTLRRQVAGTLPRFQVSIRIRPFPLSSVRLTAFRPLKLFATPQPPKRTNQTIAMKAKPSLLPILTISVLASCSGMKETRKIPVAYQAGSLESPQAANSQADLLFAAVNDYRKNKGIPELQRHAGLDRLAQDHCEYLRKNRGTFEVYGKNVSHMGDVGRCLIAIRVFRMRSTSENVAWIEPYGPETQVAQGFVTMWKQSPDHDYAMSCKDWTHTGVGAVVDTDGSVFATQLFSTTDYSTFATRDRFNSF